MSTVPIDLMREYLKIETGKRELKAIMEELENE